VEGVSSCLLDGTENGEGNRFSKFDDHRGGGHGEWVLRVWKDRKLPGDCRVIAR